MLIKNAQLRAWTRRKMKIEGPHALESGAVVFRDFEVIDASGKARKRIEATEEVTIVTKAITELLDCTALIHVNPELFTAGFVHCPSMQTVQDGARPVVIKFRAERRFDVSELSYLCDMRFTE